jgi:hypothetical protein
MTAFLFTARGHEKSASLHTFKCLKRKLQMNSCMGTCVALSIFCLNIASLTFITNARTTMPFARLHSQLVCTQSEPAFLNTCLHRKQEQTWSDGTSRNSGAD